MTNYKVLSFVNRLLSVAVVDIFWAKMAYGGVYLAFLAIILAGLFDQVAAFDGGDAAALIIGLILGIMGICACLGAYARRQQGL